MNPANAMTASRYFTLPVYIWALENGEQQIATLALIVCGTFDIFDGLVARLFRCTTQFGEVFDAITDAICYGLMLLLLPIYGLVPWTPVAWILAVGVVSFIWRAIYAWRAKRAINYRSYAMEKMAAYAAYLIGCGIAQFQITLVYWGYVVLVTIVFVHDTKRLLIDPIEPARLKPEPQPGSPVTGEGAA